MSYKLIRNSQQHPVVKLQGEPSYCKALDAAPPGREQELNTGIWLILVFAAWSVPDVRAIEIALETAKHFEGKLNLGLRPFDSPEEHKSWCTEISDNDESPLWLLFESGHLRMIHAGLLSGNILIEKIKETYIL